MYQIFRIFWSADASSCDVADVMPDAGPRWKRRDLMGTSYWCFFVCSGRDDRTSYTATRPEDEPVARHRPLSSKLMDVICTTPQSQPGGADDTARRYEGLVMRA